MAPLQSCLHDTLHLLISPDGKLSIAPFAVLTDQEGARLSSQKLISYITSGRELAAPPVDQTNSKKVIVIIDPDFDANSQARMSQGGARFTDRKAFSLLPGAKDEGREIKNLLDNVTILTGSNATVDAVKGVRAPAVLHIATHGVFSPMESTGLNWDQELLSINGEIQFIDKDSPAVLANPMFFSGLALAGANKRNINSNVGILTAQEITGLDLMGAQLVVLTACETGQGSVTMGDEFIGLRRALEIAGAATQVTSLWRSSDSSTSILIRHYYSLLKEGRGRAYALTMAQERIEHDPEHPQWKHPYYWAALVSAGSWKPMTDVLKSEPMPMEYATREL